MDAAVSGSACFVGYEGVVRDEWIDANGHMNIQWYDRVFDAAEEKLLASVGLHLDYIAREHHGMFRVEKSVRYERELLLGDEIRIECRIVAFDGKFLAHQHVLTCISRGFRAARAEYAAVHVSLATRKGVIIPNPDVLAAVVAMARAHGAKLAERVGGPVAA